ncbi:hypothetical protein TRAPUB_14395 [Trametes pubescens]|uniref:Uncharacterized protein n=1 Tax=Trametes pubescens TaxID=154538 RepID=A0A1M2VNK9_TRAPU|nr:hypothetical protein TRAPUB_14395 [Trametes pubescens]
MPGNDADAAPQPRVPGPCDLGSKVHAPGGVCPLHLGAIRGGRPRVICSDFMSVDTANIAKTRAAPPSRALQRRCSAGTPARTLSTASAAYDAPQAHISATSWRTFRDQRLFYPTRDRVRERERRTGGSWERNGRL